MKYSYRWLKELSGTKLSPEKMGELLTMKAFEVEGIEKFENDLDGVIVGQILDIQKHPNADKLQIAKVDIGSKKLQIVCGAHNIKIGDKVPVAIAGARLPNGMQIKSTEIRGEKSFGMLCAEDELGLGTDHSGILILDKKEKNGASVTEVLKVNDALLEIKVLPDRSHDALSHIGMAREICALEGRNFSYRILKTIIKKSKELEIRIQNKKLCARYMAAVVKNVEIEDSPAWIKIVTERFGINAINSIVDTTNYAMLKTGQPLHAFDLDKLARKNGKILIQVRNARSGEEIRLLDGNLYKLTKDDIVIADSQKAIALAGIMGGADSAISKTTQNIIIESANFDASAIRKTRTRLNIITDASIRFEKTIDPNLAESGLLHALENITGYLEGINDLYPLKAVSWKIMLDLEYVSRLLGEKVASNTATKILNSLGLKTSGKGRIISVGIPTFRIDLKTQEDLIEEIGRINGYEKINAQAPLVAMAPAKINEVRFFERYVKRMLIGNGFSEIHNYAFYAEKDAENAGLVRKKHLKLQNPLNPEQALMRVSLIPNMLKNVSHNLKYFKKFRIFEIGRIYLANKQNLPYEKRVLNGMVVLEKDKKHESFLEMKGFVNHMLLELGIDAFYYNDITPHFASEEGRLWYSGRSAEIKIEGSGETVGFVGEVHPVVLKKFDIKKRVALCEFNLEKLQEISEGEREYEPLRKFPEVERDISLVAKSKVRIDDILREIQRSGGKMVLNVDLFDIFDFADGSSSYAFHILLGADHTMESSEVDAIMQKISLSLEKNLKVVIRH